MPLGRNILLTLRACVLNGVNTESEKITQMEIVELNTNDCEMDEYFLF